MKSGRFDESIAQYRKALTLAMIHAEEVLKKRRVDPTQTLNAARVCNVRDRQPQVGKTRRADRAAVDPRRRDRDEEHVVERWVVGNGLQCGDSSWSAEFAPLVECGVSDQP